MLYVRFLSSLSPPLDTFATLSKVYRPSQTPHPAVSSKELSRPYGRPGSPPAPSRTSPLACADLGSPLPAPRGEKGLSSHEACWGPLLTRPLRAGGWRTAAVPHRCRRRMEDRCPEWAKEALTTPAPFGRRWTPGAARRARRVAPPRTQAATQADVRTDQSPRGPTGQRSIANETPLTLIHRVSRVATKVGVFHGRGAQGPARAGS